MRALQSGTAEVLPPFGRSRHIDIAQVQKLSKVDAPDPIGAADPDR